MLRKIEKLGAEIAESGWTREGVHRLIALVEEDGRETKAERASLERLLAENDASLGRGRKYSTPSSPAHLRSARPGATGRTAPGRTAPGRTAPDRTAPDRTALPRAPINPTSIGRAALARDARARPHTNASPTNASPTNASPTDPSPTPSPTLPPARRRELARYLDFVARAANPSPRSTLFGDGLRDVDPERYRRHVEILAGERATHLPGRKEPVVFRDRFVPSPTHQLEEVASWLEGYYRDLGFETERQPVEFRGRTYYNVIATIPGATEDRVLLCDHYDVADKEPIHPRNRAQLVRDHHLPPDEVARREGSIPIGGAVPGADDNASASAALMEMAAVMRDALDRGTKLEKTIELVHLVGEELPANCLGARAFVARAKTEGPPIVAVIVMDMIGVDRAGRKKVQISVGRPPASLDVAAEVKRSIRDLGLDLLPVLRPFGARKSFLHQTDGIHFSRAGIPVVLLNEHVNDDRDLHRAGYHDEFDITPLMSFDFATDITRAALETAFRLAKPAR